MNTCIFCSIATENIPHHEIWWRNETCLAFLDASPAQQGHTLVIPRTHSENILDLSEKEYIELMTSVRTVAEKMRRFFGVPRVAIVVEGASVAHTHVHLIPVHKAGDLGVFPKYQMEPGAFEKLGRELRDSA